MKVKIHFHQLNYHYGQNPLRQLGQSNVAADKKLTHFLNLNSSSKIYKLDYFRSIKNTDYVNSHIDSQRDLSSDNEFNALQKKIIKKKTMNIMYRTYIYA